MSTRTRVIIDHRLANYQDREATIALLQPSVHAAMAVDDYWRSVEPNEYEQAITSWISLKERTNVSCLDYRGPGSIFLRFSQNVAVLSASARWTGFLTIEPLRSVHLAAFRSIARSLGGTRLAILPDVSGVGYDATSEGLSQEECIGRLGAEYGPPQDLMEAVARRDFTKPGSGLVWFIETL